MIYSICFPNFDIFFLFNSLKAFGLETFESAALFERLLTPVVFLVVIILQVHYFHIPFLKASALNRFQ